MNLGNRKADELEAQSLKARYMRCFGARTSNATALHDAVRALFEHAASHSPQEPSSKGTSRKP
jgi:hypothetical protein